MENAVQALKIGAAMLVFSIAIATVFLIFAQARQVSETVFLSMDNDRYMEYIEGTGGNNRIVGVDTIIPTLYQYYQELYCVTIKDRSGTVIETFDIANETLDTPRMMARLDNFVNEKLLGTELKNKQFEETFYEDVYKGKIYPDPDTGETIQDINTKIKIKITYQVVN